MKKIFNFAIIALTACAAAVGCSLMEQDVTFLQNDEIQFTTNIRAYNTKADEAVATGFVNGDEVGIIAFEPINVTNVKYTVTGNKLSSETPVHWAQGQTDSTIFAAYFPYDPKFSILDNSYAFSVKEDQSIPENYRLSDFLVASGSGRPGQSVKLDFYHYFSRVDISLAGELKGKVTGVSFSGVATSYGIAYGNAGEQNATIKAGRIASTEGTDAELWSLILVPQEVAPTLLVATSDGKTLSYDLGKKMDFQSGKRYQAVLSLGDDGTLDAESVRWTVLFIFYDFSFFHYIFGFIKKSAMKFLQLFISIW